MREETQLALDNILDTFSGADGGVRFIHLRALIEDMDRQAEEGDFAGERVIDYMLNFSRLIDVAQEPEKISKKKKKKAK